MIAVYSERGPRAYPAGGDGLGVELPDRRWDLIHVQRCIAPGMGRFWVGYCEVRRQWLTVHESRLVFPAGQEAQP